MQAVLLDGKTLSETIRAELKQRLHQLGARTPTLATILVGADPASATYVRMKAKACESIGMNSQRVELPEDCSTERLLETIDQLNDDRRVAGILLQHPAPPQIDERAAFDRIAIEKDVDGVTTLGFGRMSFGLPSFASCTPAGIMRLLEAYRIPLRGRHAVVVGRSAILGRPMAALLLQQDATVTICHSRTEGLPEHVARADIVVAACGKPRLVRGEWLKPGAVVVDAGYNPGNVGDADFESCSQRASHITPVPGGVGPMTITMLLEHTVRSAEQSCANEKTTA
ncbi:MAG: bifunctional methylenetetrahydrofolate dehydrogenase/methenyltetrahydrofolate cyclohydrolase [Leptospirales bacterium]|nr:bifunctional methylenetetrahydrofolate dehydrogenase/methenyltetrahydrofolate cyclohydrolase [Leptospirales bacterium]